MAKTCSNCNTVIDDDEKVFCPVCGAVIDPKVKVALELEKINTQYKKEGPKRATAEQSQPMRGRTNNEDTDFHINKPQEESNSGAAAACVIVLLLIAAAVAYFLLR